MSDLEITPQLVIPETELAWRFGPSSGPGGQHANRSNTRAELTFDIARSEALSEGQRRRLVERFGPALTVGADDERSQRRNRDLARRRMAERLRDALAVAAPRRATRPTRAAQRKRVDAKRRRSEVKDQRRRPAPDD